MGRRNGERSRGRVERLMDQVEKMWDVDERSDLCFFYRVGCGWRERDV